MGMISKRADKVKLDDRLVRPDQSITPPIDLVRENGNTIEMHWWQDKGVSLAGLVIVEDFPNHPQNLVALRVNRFDHVNVFVGELPRPGLVILP